MFVVSRTPSSRAMMASTSGLSPSKMGDGACRAIVKLWIVPVPATVRHAGSGVRHVGQCERGEYTHVWHWSQRWMRTSPWRRPSQNGADVGVAIGRGAVCGLAISRPPEHDGGLLAHDPARSRDEGHVAVGHLAPFHLAPHLADALDQLGEATGPTGLAEAELAPVGVDREVALPGQVVLVHEGLALTLAAEAGVLDAQ